MGSEIPKKIIIFKTKSRALRFEITTVSPLIRLKFLLSEFSFWEAEAERLKASFKEK